LPANLPPPYLEAERRYRAASEVADKIAALEEMLRLIPKHKGTDKLQGDIKARLAKLRRQPAKKSARSSHSHAVPKEGAGQVVLVGAPNSGKSSLVRRLTNARPAVAPYPGTTRLPGPGMMPHLDIAFQLVDLPPLSTDYNEHWVFDIIRRADMAWLVLDGSRPLSNLETVQQVLEPRRIRLHPAQRPLPDEPELSWIQQRTLIVVTGQDRPDTEENLEIFQELVDEPWPICCVSTTQGSNLDQLGPRCAEILQIVRVYTKQPGKPPDLDKPFTVKRGCTVGELAYRIHKELAAKLRSARIWGSGAFDGQTVHRSHVLRDGDILELRN